MTGQQLTEFIRSTGLVAEAHHQGRTDHKLLMAFVARADQAAFAALVKQHGPMVMGVCRRVLHHAQDAEDAFQATFLLLARRGAGIRKHESLASWLYGVAYRMARNAKRSAARRRKHEGAVRPAPPVGRPAELEWREVQAILDDEISRLPEIYRTPFILFHLENQKQADVARQLGIQEGTVWSRLTHARRLLQVGLSRRGVALPAVLALLAVSADAAVASLGTGPAGVVPAALARSTMHAAGLLAAGESPVGAVPAGVATLLQGVHRAMFLGKLKAVVLAVVATGLAATGLGLAAHWSAAAGPPQGPQSPSATPADGPRRENPPATGKATLVAPKADEPAWKKEFDRAYALSDSEILRRVAPPYPASRSDFLKHLIAGREADFGAPPQLDEWYCAFWFKGGKVTVGPSRMGVKPETGIPLLNFLDMAADIPAQDVEGDDELLKLTVPGDFVLRKGADPVKVAAKLQDILQKDCKLDVKLTFREVEREVVVARGTFKVKPLDPKKNRVEVYAVELTDPSTGGGGSGTVPEFVRHLNAFVNLRAGGRGTTRIVNEAKFDPKETVSWHYNVRTTGRMFVDWDADHEPAAVLGNVAKQTGLALKTEKRKVRVLFVQRKLGDDKRAPAGEPPRPGALKPQDWRPPRVQDYPPRLRGLAEEYLRREAEYRERESGAKERPMAFKEVLRRYRTEHPTNAMADRFLELAGREAGRPGGVQALSFVFNQAAKTMDMDCAITGARDRAVGLAVKHYLADPDLDVFLPSLHYGVPSPKCEDLLQSALKSPHRSVRASAAYHLATFQKYKARIPEFRDGVVRRRGKDMPADQADFFLKRFDRELACYPGTTPRTCRKEAERLIDMILKDYADVPESVFERGPAEISTGKRLTIPAGAGRTFGEAADALRNEIRNLVVGREAPDIAGEDQDGKLFKLSDYRGKVVVLTFSANWCGPCVKMYPRLRAIQDRHKDKPFAVLSVTADQEARTVREAVGAGKITWRCWWDGAGGPIARAWNVQSWPTVYVLDEKGIIRASNVQAEDLEKLVAALLKK